MYSVIAILFFIARSKLVPDFAITLHIIHLLVTSFYSHSIPRNWLWWALQVVSAGMMTSLGVWSCQWRELRPITFGGSSAAQASSSETAALPNTGETGDEEQGYGRGRGRGRGRDGAGEYEMVDRNPEAEAAK
jgi:ABC-type nickel/cobalt efflux system permease component RcnA